LAIATGDWLSASTILTSLISVNPGNKIAINNLAVCMIYLGKLQEASALMESLKSNEIEEGFEEINLNLNTLKELSG
jgi:Flp pilus assembly protein TadD